MSDRLLPGPEDAVLVEKFEAKLIRAGLGVIEPLTSNPRVVTGVDFERIGDPNDDPTFDAAFRVVGIRAVREAVRNPKLLNERERSAVIQRHGLFGHDASILNNVEMIGLLSGEQVTKQTVRMVLAHAHSKLRWARKELEAYIGEPYEPEMYRSPWDMRREENILVTLLPYLRDNPDFEVFAADSALGLLQRYCSFANIESIDELTANPIFRARFLDRTFSTFARRFAVRHETELMQLVDQTKERDPAQLHGVSEDGIVQKVKAILERDEEGRVSHYFILRYPYSRPFALSDVELAVKSLRKNPDEEQSMKTADELSTLLLSSLQKRY